MIRIAIPTNRPQAVVNYVNALTQLGARTETGREFIPEEYDGLLLPGGWDVNAPLSFEKSRPADAFVERVNAFTEACGRIGARVFFRFCPMNIKAFPPGEIEKADVFEQSLRDLLRHADRS